MKHFSCYAWIGLACMALMLGTLHIVVLRAGGWIAAWLYWSLIAGLALGQVLHSRR